jgi:hypothetical protein
MPFGHRSEPAPEDCSRLVIACTVGSIGCVDDASASILQMNLQAGKGNHMKYERPHIEESRPLEAVLTWGPKNNSNKKKPGHRNHS